MPDPAPTSSPGDTSPTQLQSLGHQPIDLPRKVGFWGAIAVMVGVVIGSGIFRTPGAAGDSPID